MPDLRSTNDFEIPPFPRLDWVGDCWEGTVTLPAWAGFQSRGGAYGSRDSSKPSDGKARLNVSSPNPDQREPPSLAQRNAYETLLSKQDRIRDAMLVALMDKYARWRANWADAMGEQIEELMPAVSDPTNFRVLIGLSNIHVLNVEREGRAYVGFELGCTWDDEHGLGFMTHGDRVVKVGGADTSFLEWIAERDVKAT